MDPDDYTEITTTQVSFVAGDTSEDVVVTIANDSIFENSESFLIDLSNPANATIADNQGEGTILDDGTGTGGTDNDTPTVSVDDVTATEGTDSHAVFTVSLSNASAEANIFSLALADDTATGAGTDYGTAGADNIQVFVSGSWANATSVTIPAGSMSVQVRTAITDDAIDEPVRPSTLPQQERLARPPMLVPPVPAPLPMMTALRRLWSMMSPLMKPPEQ